MAGWTALLGRQVLTRPIRCVRPVLEIETVTDKLKAKNRSRHRSALGRLRTFAMLRNRSLSNRKVRTDERVEMTWDAYNQATETLKKTPRPTEPSSDRASGGLSSMRLQQLIRRNSKRARDFVEVVDRYISHASFYVSYERTMKSCLKSQRFLGPLLLRT